MAALLHNLPLVQHADQISLPDRAESVGNHKHGVLPFELVDGLLHQPFALGVEGAGGFIEDQQLWIAQDGSGQGKALALAAAEAVAAFADQGVVAFWKIRDETIGLGFFCGGRYFCLRSVGAAMADVVRNRGIKKKGVLAHDPKVLLPADQIEIIQWGSIDQDLAFGGVVEADISAS